MLRQIYADAPGQGNVVWNLGARARKKAESEFVYKSDTSDSFTTSAPAVTPVPSGIEHYMVGHLAPRIPISTRCHPEIAAALKRQLAGKRPFYAQEIVNQVILGGIDKHAL